MPRKSAVNQRRGPLSGLRVFDMTIAAVGPWASMLLGALGAEVIKVEAPDPGDMIRTVLPEKKKMSVVYAHCNINKKGIVLNLKREDHRAVALDLVKTCDVFVENMTQGTVDKLGLSYEVVSRLNPRIIYCSVNAYGYVGPMAQDGGNDPTLQAFTAWHTIQGPPGAPGEILRYYAHKDLNTSSYVVAAILQALVHRARTGQGQRIRLSMTECSLALQATRLAEYFATGKPPLPMGSACPTIVPQEAFRCQEGKYLAVAVVEDSQWPRLCHAIGQGDLAADPRFATNPLRVQNRDALIPQIAETFATKPAAWWVYRLTEARVPHACFLDYTVLLTHPQVLENRFILPMETPWGAMYMGGVPWYFEKTPAAYRKGTTVGGATEEVARSLGFTLSAPDSEAVRVSFGK